MRINSIDNSTFGSKLKYNSEMASVFSDASYNYNRIFLTSAKAIINDGKNDVVELHKADDSHLQLLVNGKVENESSIFNNILPEVGQNMLKEYAQKITGKDMGFEALSMTEEEQLLIAPEAIAIYAFLNPLFQNTSKNVDNMKFYYDTLAIVFEKWAQATKKQINQLHEQVISDSKDLY